MLTNQEHLETSSQISSISSKPDNFFITGAKTKSKGKKATYKSGGADSPTAKAAQVLAVFNNKEDKDLDSEEEDALEYGNPGVLAEKEINRTEREMNAMMQELNDIEQ